MADEIMTAIASALAAKAADAVAGAAQQAWTRLVRLVRDRLGSGSPEAAVLEHARNRPSDRVAVHQLAQALEQAATADQGFGAELRALWLQVAPALAASEASAVNVVTGTVGGHLIQARDLHVDGGIHFGDVQGRPPS